MDLDADQIDGGSDGSSGSRCDVAGEQAFFNGQSTTIEADSAAVIGRVGDKDGIDARARRLVKSDSTTKETGFVRSDFVVLEEESTQSAIHSSTNQGCVGDESILSQINLSACLLYTSPSPRD